MIRTKPYNNDIIFLCFQLRLLPFLLLLQRPASPEGKAIEDCDGIHRSLQNPTIGKASRKLPSTGNVSKSLPFYTYPCKTDLSRLNCQILIGKPYRVIGSDRIAQTKWKKSVIIIIVKPTISKVFVSMDQPNFKELGISIMNR